ncbi:MAG: hypothetical protein EBS09_03175 [Flavobacteriia bacterium]|nr:hypothetical protein [Flavobacteriia bacterium]
MGSAGRIGRKSSISRLRGKQGNYLAKNIDKITLGSTSPFEGGTRSYLAKNMDKITLGSTSPFEGGKRGMTDLQIFIIRFRLIFSTKSPKTSLIAEESYISSPFVPLPRGKQEVI